MSDHQPNDENVLPDGGDVPRETVSIPTEIELPRLLDFYELQDAEHTQIHEFYENLRDGRFTTTECRECGELHFPPRIVCPECTSDDLEYVDLPHEGEMYSFTEVRGTSAIGMNDDTPFVAGVVDLGPVRLSARVDDASYEDLEIGSKVQLKIVEIDGPTDQERVFYRFTPV
ncbi:Zn-ribbon domain-containing OB-fold protein [Haloferax denitrificans]|uniref:Zn-ribbon domain-containing OB-fold protein n=1 Tax=Haloferax denitrificans TaxID=35745 RepID=UPI003C704DD4